LFRESFPALLQTRNGGEAGMFEPALQTQSSIMKNRNEALGSASALPPPQARPRVFNNLVICLFIALTIYLFMPDKDEFLSVSY